MAADGKMTLLSVLLWIAAGAAADEAPGLELEAAKLGVPFDRYTTKDALGHPYRRWSSFLPHSTTEELLRTKARIYVAAGTRDAVIPVAAHDMLVAELRARGRDVTAERLEGADHGFLAEERPRPPAGMQAVLGRVLQWLLGEEEKSR
jgi:pimeloyl-ACP methyl ester carboxylesterase